ncbi:hypothetical protein D0Z07_8264 [Hyphodiscus hymeniophilus]|uniref:Uncharacterized protein n=1 Tax=Hyphodiscus hymeniophilus TaxID=353542 RepID=A0A9P6VE98_9HELO|nr:hypothetical protein D0Z07_8264 [Hyphodiscus hymeniophilus]
MSSQSSTPARSTRSQRSKIKSPRAARDGSPYFSPRRQDAQARNKDPYASDSSDSQAEASGKRFDAYGNDTYEQIQRRREAAIVLDSPELLMMHAQARNDSIPGTRYYFTKMLCGYLDENDTYEVIKEPPKEASKEPEKGKEKNQGKGKARESAGGSS